MNTAYFYLTAEGRALAEKLNASHPGDLFGRDNFSQSLTRAFSSYDNLVCIMATGIVVRILAPLLVHKTKDPAVVVLDQRGQYAISLLSGHLGGANDLAREMARIAGGSAVITTATDVEGQLSFDSFAKARGMAIENINELKHISGALLSNRPVRVYSDRAYDELTGNALLDVRPLSGIGKAGEEKNTGLMPPCVVIDEGYSFEKDPGVPVLYLRPRTICAGIGCKRGMDQASIRSALETTLKMYGLSPRSLSCIATIPLKADEEGILGTAKHFQLPLKVIPTEQIKALDVRSLGIGTSDFVEKNTGVASVSTASAYLASNQGTILCDKEKFRGITIALARISGD